VNSSCELIGIEEYVLAGVGIGEWGEGVEFK